MSAPKEITLEQLRSMMLKNGVIQLLAKDLSANDNAKNQPYLGGSMDVVNILPVGEVRSEITEKGNKSLKAPVDLSWLQSDGSFEIAPGTQIILYPQYPEVRLSGFLRGCAKAPSELLNKRVEGRVLFLGITKDRKIIAAAVGPDTTLAKQYLALGTLEKIGVFGIVPLSQIGIQGTRGQLLAELRRIHFLSWINSKALNGDGTTRPCTSSNCVGYTLEAELGVPRNGRSEPDFKGWEVKAGIVSDFARQTTKKPITLMTPEPTGGYYRTEGVAAFIREFGYVDKLGRADRMNFGGIYRWGQRHPSTHLKLCLLGFDTKKNMMTDPDGSLALISDTDVIAAEWSFSALMNLWKRKHAQAAYIPALMRENPTRQYCYGSKIRLGTGTKIETFLSAIAAGHVYYDPGIKLENASTKKPKIKRRSQFRISSSELQKLYAKMETVDVSE